VRPELNGLWLEKVRFVDLDPELCGKLKERKVRASVWSGEFPLEIQLEVFVWGIEGRYFLFVVRLPCCVAMGRRMFALGLATPQVSVGSVVVLIR
jgi:hypothetical protein